MSSGYTSLLQRLFVFSGVLVSLSAGAQDPLAYRDRGDRHEGVKSKPVSGYDIELIGAVIESGDVASTDLPERLALRFFLERAEEVYLTVRERDPEEFYWLDQVRPARAWLPQATNVFTWPSVDVLRPLRLTPSDLVALVRLGQSTPSRRERVAPVILGESQQVAAYRFTFKINATAKIRHRIFGPASSETPVASGPERRRSAGVPFDVRWTADGQPEGHYRLLVEGYFRNDNSRLLQEVQLFHTASWPR